MVVTDRFMGTLERLPPLAQPPGIASRFLSVEILKNIL